jgi:hypothetical protein
MLSGEHAAGRPEPYSTHASRRIAWNGTLVIGGVFGIVAGAAPNFTVLGVFVAFIVRLALSGMDGCVIGKGHHRR